MPLNQCDAVKSPLWGQPANQKTDWTVLLLVPPFNSETDYFVIPDSESKQATYICKSKSLYFM